jgi:FtsH-binding integral membrane protein
MTTLISEPNSTHQTIGASDSTQRAFLVKTYAHLFLGILLFFVFGYLLYTLKVGVLMSNLLSGTFTALIGFGLFVLASTTAQSFAMRQSTKLVQYCALTLYALVEAVFFSPLFLVAVATKLLLPAIGITLAIFAALTAIVMVTGKDFSFLRSILFYVGFAVFGVIILGFFFPALVTGIGFAAFMIVFAGTYILYDTSRVLRDMDKTNYIGASVSLLASFILLLWYVIRFLLAFGKR